MKKKFLYSMIILSVFVFQSAALSIQQKNDDYIIVPDTQIEQQEESIKTQIDNSNGVYDKITPIGNYFKIKKDGKFGVIDKNGNIILSPVFQKIYIYNVDDYECFAAKANGKYRLYYNTGNVVSEEELYPIVQNTSVMTEKELMPQFEAVIEKKEVIYSHTMAQNNAVQTATENYVYEIKEIPLQKVKRHTSCKEHTIKTTEDLHYAFNAKKDMFTVNKSQFYIVRENGKLGISNLNDEMIIPSVYDSFSLKTPCKHFRNPVFLVMQDSIPAIYNIKGQLLAEQVYKKINVYRNGDLYTYENEDGENVLRKNGKRIGVFIYEDEKIKFVSDKFFIFRPHIVNNLILTILNK